jgi:hypothetical protein
VEDLTRARVEEILISEWKQRTMNSESNESNSEVFVTRTSKFQNKQKTKDLKCFNCGKIGHKKAECWSAISQNKPNDVQPETKGKKKNIATCLRTNSNQVEVKLPTTAWIVDSAATNHISFDRSDFVDFVEADERVEWGTDASCEVRGRGKILLSWNFAGRKETMTVNSALYIPSFRYKVLSMGLAASSRDWSFHIKGDVMKAYFGPKVAFISKKNDEHFYVTNFKVQKPVTVSCTTRMENSKSEPPCSGAMTEGKGDQLEDMKSVANSVQREATLKSKSKKKRRKKPRFKRKCKNISEAIPATDVIEIQADTNSENSGMKESSLVSLACKSVKKSDMANIWHRRFAHVCCRKLQEMQRKGIVRGMEGNDTVKIDSVCECCLEMKATRLKFNKKGRERAQGILDLVHTDVCGPIGVESMGGGKIYPYFYRRYFP